MTKENDFISNPNLDSQESAKEIRSKIIQLVKEYAEISHKKKEFISGKSFVPTSGRVYDFDEITNLSKSLRVLLKEYFYISTPKICSETKSSDGSIK